MYASSRQRDGSGATRRRGSIAATRRHDSAAVTGRRNGTLATNRRRDTRQRTVYRRRRISVAIAIVLLAGSARLLTESSPALTTTPALAASVKFPGQPPRPDWPTHGQSAISVAGIGSLENTSTTTPEPIASVAKVMTAYLVLRDHPVPVGAAGFAITIGAPDVEDLEARRAENQSVVAVAAGEELDEYQMLEALLIPSGNNIAPILADYDSGGIAAFVTRMNTVAKALGMTQTTYTDPSGFDATTVSTATDQVILTKAAMAIPTFAEIVGEHSATLPVAGVVTNFDTLVGTDGFLGTKTGSDSTSGGCFVFAVRRTIDGKIVTLFGAVLGQEVGVRTTTILVNAALAAGRALADSVLSQLSVRSVVPAGTVVLIARNAQGHHVSVVTVSPLDRLGWGGLTIPVRVAVFPPGTGLQKGQRLATVTAVETSPLVTAAAATASMPGLSLGWKLEHLL